LAHPRHPATIYLLFVPHTFVSWPPLPSAVLRGFTAAKTRGERLSAYPPPLPLHLPLPPPHPRFFFFVVRSRSRSSTALRGVESFGRVGPERDLINGLELISAIASLFDLNLRIDYCSYCHFYVYKSIRLIFHSQQFFMQLQIAFYKINFF